MRAILLRATSARKDIERRSTRSAAAAALYDKTIGPLDGVYKSAIEASSVLYDRAKERHAKGIQVLEEKFDFHPLYSKGRKDEFRGQPFAPR
jgi:hypothetical protein